MRQRITRLILAGTAACAAGLGALALPGHHAGSPASEVSLPETTHVAAVSDLDLRDRANAQPDAQPNVLLKNQTLGSYFWDTGGSGNGDTGAPASGTPMREGCFASPSWPMGTKGFIEYHGKRAAFVICDRGPGTPSRDGVMIDIDGITYAKLTGGTWAEPYVVGGNGLHGHIPITYWVTQWGEGPGKGAPKPL